MSGTTVRINKVTRDKIRELATREKQSMNVIIDRAVEDYRRKCFLEDANRAYGTLRQNSDAWKAEEEERAAWDVTLMDGQEKK